MNDKDRLSHIIDAINDIEECLKEASTYKQFINNTAVRWATIKLFEVIGEASNHLSDDLKDQFSEVEWSTIIGMRHILVHEYFVVSYETIWKTIQKDLPDFKRQIEQIWQSLQ